MNSSFKQLFEKVCEQISKRNFQEAFKIVEPHASNKDRFIYRSLFLIYGTQTSSFFSPSKASPYLDKLVENGDPWGLVEKAKCLMSGTIYKKNTFLAEDSLVAALKKGDTRAKFYLARIHGEGLHIRDGEKIYDEDQAVDLYREISLSGGQYASKAKLEYTKILMRKKNPSKDDELDIFSNLLSLDSEGKQDISYLFSDFLISFMKKLSKDIFSEKNVPKTMEQKIEFETKHRECMLSLEKLKSIISKRV